MTDVRLITSDEAADWIRAMRAGFLGSASEETVQAWLPHVPIGRARGAFDGSVPVGTLASFAMDLSVPGGGLLPVSGLTMVTMRPTHRRQGLARRLLTADLTESLRRGEAASVLIASEYPIYGRFGYGQATDHVALELDTRSVRMRPDAPGDGHTIEMVTSQALRTIGPELFARVRGLRPGGVSRAEWWWDAELGISPALELRTPTRFAALCRDPDGTPVGYVRYDVDEHWPQRRPKNVLLVRELVATSPAAEARLWRHLVETDLVVTVKAQDRPVDDLLPWLVTDARAVRQRWRADMLWLRALDVPALLQARRYPADGSLVLQVTDPMGVCDGTYRLEVGGGTATCTRTRPLAGAVPDVDLLVPSATLGAVYLGGTSVRTLAAAGRLEERSPGAAELADALFRWPVAPWCTTWF